MAAPRAWLVLGLVAVAVVSGTQAAWIHVKAELAQRLLARSWERVREGATHAPPWPWADTTPVAALSVARLDREMLVLGDASARNLAFGPAHVAGSAAPGEVGNSVLTGHRDTHFAFLRGLRLGDRLEITDRTGRISSYRVESLDVVDVGSLHLIADAPRRELTLVTCYPFDSVAPGGPLRYVVRAVELGPGGDPRDVRVLRPGGRLLPGRSAALHRRPQVPPHHLRNPSALPALALRLRIPGGSRADREALLRLGPGVCRPPRRACRRHGAHRLALPRLDALPRSPDRDARDAVGRRARPFGTGAHLAWAASRRDRSLDPSR